MLLIQKLERTYFRWRLWIYKLILQIGTPPIEDLPIFWDEIGLWESIEMGKSLGIFERNYFLFAECKNIDFFFLYKFVKKIVFF